MLFRSENRSAAHDVIRADTAFVMLNLLRGVTTHGTGAAAASLNWPIAGKTGTVDDNTDAWFIGFDPDVTVGVWTGLDEKKPIGRTETGAQAALPIWMEFMKASIDRRRAPDTSPDFTPPSNIVLVSVDKATGAILPGGASGGISEAFIAGTEPGASPFPRLP